jgi:DNA-binding transcriptional MerR regulator
MNWLTPCPIITETSLDTRLRSDTIWEASGVNSKRERHNMLKTKKSRPEGSSSSKNYTSSEVSDIATVSLRQLQWWDERKVVSPRHEGHKRVYTPEEVVEITVIAELRRKGFSLQKIRRVLRFLQREMDRRLSEVLQTNSDLHLVTDGKSIYLEDQQDKIIDILKNARQPMFLVCVSDQVRRLNEPNRKPAKAEGTAAARRTRVG